MCFPSIHVGVVVRQPHPHNRLLGTLDLVRGILCAELLEVCIARYTPTTIVVRVVWGEKRLDLVQGGLEQTRVERHPEGVEERPAGAAVVSRREDTPRRAGHRLGRWRGFRATPRVAPAPLLVALGEHLRLVTREVVVDAPAEDEGDDLLRGAPRRVETAARNLRDVVGDLPPSLGWVVSPIAYAGVGHK